MPSHTKSAPAGHKDVEVIVDGTPHKIPSGDYLVSAFKDRFGIDPTKELEEVIEGKLAPLADTDTIDLQKSGRRFVSHVRRGGSS